jgi:hypothetical protein
MPPRQPTKLRPRLSYNRMNQVLAAAATGRAPRLGPVIPYARINAACKEDVMLCVYLKEFEMSVEPCRSSCCEEWKEGHDMLIFKHVPFDVFRGLTNASPRPASDPVTCSGTWVSGERKMCHQDHVSVSQDTWDSRGQLHTTVFYPENRAVGDDRSLNAVCHDVHTHLMREFYGGNVDGVGTRAKSSRLGQGFRTYFVYREDQEHVRCLDGHLHDIPNSSYNGKGPKTVNNLCGLSAWAPLVKAYVKNRRPLPAGRSVDEDKLTRVVERIHANYVRRVRDLLDRFIAVHAALYAQSTTQKVPPN